MRAAVTKHLWRITQAWRGNPTSYLRQEVMRVIGVRVQGDMTVSRSGLANSRELLDNANQRTTFCVYMWISEFHLTV